MSRFRASLVMTATILGSAGVTLAMGWPRWVAMILGPAIYMVGTCAARGIPSRERTPAPDSCRDHTGATEREPEDLRLVRRRD